MVLTRTQLDSVLNEKLGQQFLTFSNIANKLQSLMNWFYNFIGKYDILYLELLGPFLKLGFTPCKAKQEFQGVAWSYKKKKHKKITGYRKSV